MPLVIFTNKNFLGDIRFEEQQLIALYDLCVSACSMRD